MGVKINNVTYRNVYNTITRNINNKGYICLTDVANVVTASKDNEFLQAINQSLLSIPDGTPLAWYGKLLGCTEIERISGPELMRRLLEHQDGLCHYLLGDTEQTINKIIQKARFNNPNLKIYGHSPPFKNNFNQDDNRHIITKINNHNPDIVWVSFGGGKQDKWMYHNFHSARRGLFIGVGAAFRFYIGELKTPPIIFQKLGVQWAFRTLQEPRGLKCRLKTYPIFVINFCSEILKNKKKMHKN
jgi:N-acetylglucosaminyldiphosphoundecaprenol N-acetyl-beta-D-mannosaminyltransferase